MTAVVLDGEPVAATIRASLLERVAALAGGGHRPGLATVLVGDDGPSANYVAMKHRDCAEVGIESFDIHLAATATAAEVAAELGRLNADVAVDAYLLQHYTPFPAHLDFDDLLLQIDPAKDADGLHPVNLGKLVIGSHGPLPCTPAGIVELLAHHEVPVEGRHVVVIGRGLTIGRPLANLLALKRPGLNAAVTVVHTGVERERFAALCRSADVLVAAAGAPGLVTPDLVQPGAAVVAAGVTVTVGDDGRRRVASDVVPEVAETAGWLSPKVGGVGPMTRALLLRNCVDAAERAHP